MNKNDYSLTIAIPTYNRPKTLEKLIIQLSREKGEFTILISDDCSPDNDKTEKMVKKYQRKMKNLVYHKNDVNLGYSGNVCELYELCKTRYIWFFCDDDMILPGAILKIKRALKKYNPVVAIFNCIWTDPYGMDEIAGPLKTRCYTNISELDDYQPLQRLTFLSLIVMERRHSIDIIKETNYTDNVFVQLTIALQLLSDKFAYCEIAENLLIRYVGYKYGDFFKFYFVDHLKAVHIIGHKFDNEKFIYWAKRHILTSLKLYLSQKLGLFIYEKTPTEQTKQYIKKYYGFFYSKIILSFPFLKRIIPTILLKAIYFSKLVMMHGYKEAKSVYKKNINRAYIDDRKTGFTEYR